MALFGGGTFIRFEDTTLLCHKNDIFTKTYFINKNFSNLIPVTCQNFKKYLNKVSGDEGMVLKMLSV